MSIAHSNIPSSHFEIRFESLFSVGRSLVFPCDEEGRVDINALSERCRCSYFFARVMLGREFAAPRVISCSQPTGHSGSQGGLLLGALEVAP